MTKKSVPITDDENESASGGPHRSAQSAQQELLASMAQSYFETDLKGRLTSCNDFVCSFLDRTRKELYRLSFRDLIPAEQTHKVFEAFHEVFLTGNPSPIMEYDLIRKDGTVVSAETVVALRRDATNRPIGFCGISRDVTSRKKTATALRESEESYRRIMELAPDMICISRVRDDVIMAVNDAFCECTGYGRPDAIGRTSLDMELYTDPAHRRRWMQLLKRDGKVEKMQLQVKARDGSIQDHLFSAQFVRFNGEDCVLKVITDITELKKTQRALEEREQRYQTILEAFPYTISITRLSDSRFVQVNRGFTNRTGYSPEEVLGRSSVEVNIFKNPTDRERLRDAMFRDGKVDGMEIAFQGKGDRVTEALVSCRRIQYEGDDCLMVISVDVSDLKKVQRALRDSEESHRSILEASPYSISIARLSDWSFVEVNEIFCQRTGFTKDEVIGRTSSDLNLYTNPADRERFIETFRRDGQVDRLEIVFRAKDGRSLENLVGARPIRFRGQDCVLTISTNISGLKETQRALQESEASYRTILQAAPYSITISRMSNGRYVEVNEAFSQRTGYRPEEAIGRTVTELNLFENRADLKSFLKTFSEKGRVDNMEIRYRTRGGAITTSLVSARPIHYRGEACLLFISSNIDALKETQRALEESEASYRTILQTAPYSITISSMSDGRYVEVNEAFCQRAGYRPEETIGRTALEMNLYEDPADLKCFLKVFRDKGHVDNMEIRHRTRTGAITTSLVSARPIQYKGEACVLFITSDIDALKEVQRALEESEARFRTVFETAADPIFLNDVHSGRFIDVNQAACKHLGYDRSDFLKISIADISDPPCAYPLTDLCRRPAGPNPLFFETLHVRRDGSKAIVEVSSQVMTHQGKKALLSIARDVTRRKKTEQELARYRENLEQMVAERTRELEAAQNELVKSEKLAVLGQLTATVSHELRNPLGVIRSSNFYLQRRVKTQDEKIDKHFRRIEDQVSICEAIVADLLEYTRGRHASMVKQDLAPWLEQVVEQIQEQEGVAIDVQISGVLPPIPHDQEKMRRVMINVLLNAVQAVNSRADKATDEDPAYEPRIAVCASKRDNVLIIDVRDNGIGMSEETRRRAFEPLFTTRARGTGIGLANVKKIVEEHGGTIALESRPGQGTKITLALPYPSGH